jgi:hypothetical protein
MTIHAPRDEHIAVVAAVVTGVAVVVFVALLTIWRG